MKREQIKDFKKIVLPFFKNYLLKVNYENRGKSDAEVFEKDFNEILSLADKALDQEAKDYKTQYENYLNKSEVVISQLRADRDRLRDAFDKVKAEMFEEMLSHSGTGEEAIQAYADGLKKGLDILDKYKAESGE